jgi:Transposase DNA-binding/Transposase Tn5 dimerisation domain
MGWSDSEMANLKTGDKRLDNRVKKTIERMAASTDSSFPSCFKSRAELIGAYRLFDNEFVTPKKILESHYECVAQRSATQSLVLLLNDTSSLDYTSRQIDDLGMLEKTYTKGFFLHPTLAVTPGRQCLGIMDNCIWTRLPNQGRSKIPASTRGRQPIEEKESYRWLESYRQAADFAKKVKTTNFVFITDREGDVLELLTEAVNREIPNLDLLIRAKHDRILPEEGEEKKLKANMRKAPEIARIRFKIQGRKGQKSREVEQSIRVKEIILKGKTTTKRTYDSVRIHALLCVEEAPPKGVEAVSWLLLTTLPIFTKEEALKTVQYYLCRWEIETFFNVLKNGCKVEERELQTRDRLETMITMFMIVAWRVMFLMNLGRQDSNRSSAEVFEEVEWKSVCTILNKQVPKIAPKLGEFMIMIGMLGGYQKRKSPPGAQVVWEGLKRMADYVLMWEHIHANSSIKSCV